MARVPTEPQSEKHTRQEAQLACKAQESQETREAEVPQPKERIYRTASPNDPVYYPKGDVCDLCSEHFGKRIHFKGSNADLVRHEKAAHLWDEQLKQLKYRCPVCRHATLQFANLETHINSQHRGLKVLCPFDECYYLGSDPSAISHHKKSAHGHKTERDTRLNTNAYIPRPVQDYTDVGPYSFVSPSPPNVAQPLSEYFDPHGPEAAGPSQLHPPTKGRKRAAEDSDEDYCSMPAAKKHKQLPSVSISDDDGPTARRSRTRRSRGVAQAPRARATWVYPDTFIPATPLDLEAMYGSASASLSTVSLPSDVSSPLSSVPSTACTPSPFDLPLSSPPTPIERSLPGINVEDYATALLKMWEAGVVPAGFVPAATAYANCNSCCGAAQCSVSSNAQTDETFYDPFAPLPAELAVFAPPTVLPNYEVPAWHDLTFDDDVIFDMEQSMRDALSSGADENALWNTGAWAPLSPASLSAATDLFSSPPPWFQQMSPVFPSPPFYPTPKPEMPPLGGALSPLVTTQNLSSEDITFDQFLAQYGGDVDP